MPEMNEIYFHHAEQYHELVKAEDYCNNLKKLLLNKVIWEDARVMEAGIGTGRVTGLVIDLVRFWYGFDHSQHMLNYAKGNLSQYDDKLDLRKAPNLDLPEISGLVDIFIEGWSFGHSITACSGIDEITITTRKLVRNAFKNLRQGGKAIFIETLGTNKSDAMPPVPSLAYFYQELEKQHGFKRYVIETDYRFPSNQEAARIMGFFFGETMMQSVLKRGTKIIPERTGVWIGSPAY